MMNSSIQPKSIREPRVFRRGVWAKLVTLTVLAGGIVSASLLACANIANRDDADPQIVASSSSMRAYPPNDVDPGGYGPRAGYGADDPGGPSDPGAFAASHPETPRVQVRESKRSRRSS
jgi:hypothetical protein